MYTTHATSTTDSLLAALVNNEYILWSVYTHQLRALRRGEGEVGVLAATLPGATRRRVAQNVPAVNGESIGVTTNWGTLARTAPFLMAGER